MEPGRLVGRGLCAAGATDLPGLVLRELTGADCDAYYELITLNRDHLGRHGDYLQESSATRDWVVAYFAGRGSVGMRLAQPTFLRGNA